MLFDWGASQFLTEQFLVGSVGYAYDEVGCNSGSGDRVGCFQSPRIRRRAAGRVHHSHQRDNPRAISTSKAYREFRQCQPAGRLERMGHIRTLASTGNAERSFTAHEVDVERRPNKPWRVQSRQDIASIIIAR